MIFFATMRKAVEGHRVEISSRRSSLATMSQDPIL